MFMGIGDENTTFPTVLSCPLCNKSTLHCYDDTAREDIWFACDTCSAHGNIITFAAQIWKISADKAFARFKEQNMCTYAENMEETGKLAKAVERGLAADRFWSSAQAQLWAHDDPNILHKFRDFGVSREIPCEKLVGVAYPEQVAELCKAVTRAFPPTLSKEPVIVLPYHDLPQRISGFLLLQPHEDLSLHKSFVGVTRSAKFKPDAGYYLIDMAQLPAKKVFNNSLFIVDDPLWALKAQTTQLWYGDAFLPLCASFHGKEATSYGLMLQSFPHSKRFFAAKTVTPGLVSEVAAAQGYICIPPTRVKSTPSSPKKTLKLLGDIARAATTWQTALEHVFRSQTNLAAQAFVANLNIPREKLQRFLQTRTALADTEIGKLLERVIPHHGVSIYKRCFGDIIERDDCWYTTSGLLVSDAIPVISRVIYTDDGDKYYEGYVKKRGAIYEFFTSAVEVDRPGLLNYIGKMMATHGELVTCMLSWNMRALMIALSAKPPQVVTASAAPGWNDKTREFQFKKYVIKSDGSVAPSTCPAICDKNPIDFPEPVSAAVGELSELVTPTSENSMLWAITAAGLAGMLAPAMNAESIGFAVDARSYSKIEPQAENLGIELRMLSPGRGGTVPAITRNNNWPVLIGSVGDDDAHLQDVLIKHVYSPVFVKTLRHTLVTAASYGWHTIDPDVDFGPLPDATAIQFVIPGYIQHVMRNRFVRRPNVSLPVAVLHDLHKWVSATYGCEFNAHAAERLFIPPTAAHLLFMRDLNNAIDNGEISVLPHPRNSRQPKDFIIRNRQHWWIGKKTIQEYYKRQTSIAPNWQALLNCFAQHGVLVGEREINKASGCLLQKAWCDNFRNAENPTEEKQVG